VVARLLRRLTSLAIDVAIRRWPAELRAEVDAEWAGEMHMLSDRPWQAFSYATSLAFSRPDRDLGFGWRRAGAFAWSAAVLVALPVVGTALTLAALMGLAMHSSVNSYTGLAALVAAIPTGIAAWWLGRRQSRHPFLGTATAATSWTTGVLAILLLSVMIAYDTATRSSYPPGTLEVGVFSWAVVIWLSGFGLCSVRRRWHRTLVAALGGLGSWVTGLTAAGMMATDNWSYAPMWWIVSLVDVSEPDSALRWGTFPITDSLALIMLIVIPAAVVGLSYLTGYASGRRSATEAKLAKGAV
jgi:hypothetical protein